jgi:ABC-type cobalamin/Fe3+-siderophores transport system ATPase subunit
MTAIDWDAAITALHAGELPCSGGERRILQLAASLAAGTPVSLRDTVTGLDQDNTARLLTAIQRAAGWRSGDNGYR